MFFLSFILDWLVIVTITIEVKHIMCLMMQCYTEASIFVLLMYSLLILYYWSMIVFIFQDDAQVAELVAEFKEATQKLIDLLDISLPGVAKLKVGGRYCVS